MSVELWRKNTKKTVIFPWEVYRFYSDRETSCRVPSLCRLIIRRRELPEIRTYKFNMRTIREQVELNLPIQGTAADVIKLAMVRVWRRLRDEKMESRLILTVHDELIVEAPEAEAEKAAQILREEMEGCVQYAVPLSTDVHAGKNWLEAH